MSSNYFNNFNSYSEQTLLEDLVVESINIYGHSVYYCIRDTVNKDDIYGEATLSHYNKAYLTDVYIKSFDSYEGDGTFLSKFNLEIRDQITFTMARRTFKGDVTNFDINIERPREGDLIYSEMIKRLFIVKFVNNTNLFYPLGALQTWDVVCDVFEYSNERFDTGIQEIDDIERNYSVSKEEFGIITGDGYTLLDNKGFPVIQGQFDFDTQMKDVFADNDEFTAENEAKDIIDWSISDPFSASLD